MKTVSKQEKRKSKVVPMSNEKDQLIKDFLAMPSPEEELASVQRLANSYIEAGYPADDMNAIITELEKRVRLKH